MDFLYSIIYSGQYYPATSAERRGVILSNAIGLSLFSLSLTLAVFYFIWYGWNVVTAAIPCIALLAFSVVLLNRAGFINISRIWISLLMPIIITALSIYSKTIYYQWKDELDYFTFRFIIMASCVFPWILFSMREKKLLGFCSLAGLVILLCYDPLHEVFDVGYPKHTLKSSSYYFSNIVILISYLILISGLGFLKHISERNEQRNAELINKLNDANASLTDKNTEIEAQSSQLVAQSKILETNQKQLMSAYLTIHEQKTNLMNQNESLTTELIEKNKDLTETNSELIKHNNELRQFSYTVSHNLRGPVASLMGLIELLNVTQISPEDHEVIDYIRTSSHRLDAIIKDLTKIIDIRHDIFRIRQKLSIAQEIADVTSILSKDISDHQVQIIPNLNVTHLYSVRPMVHSILYNLLNNALKYRSAERSPVITITSRETDEFFILEITDNGLGIDLKQHKDNIFKLYRRFHFHTEGKGLGLYLIKLQVEALGGHVTVESEINRFTRFILSLRKPENVERQILLHEPHAEIFFDAYINAIGLIWHGPLTSQQYRAVYLKVLEFVKIYYTPNYVVDMSQQGHIEKEDQHWLFTQIIPDAARNGLTRIAAVRPDAADLHVREYLVNINDNLAKVGISQEFFQSMPEALDWLEAENEQMALKMKPYGTTD